MNSEDEIRKKILGYLYDRFMNSRSATLIPAVEPEIIRSLENYSTEEIARNILYLVDSGFLKKELRKGLHKRSIPTYRVSDKTVNRFQQHESEFMKINNFSGINITNIQGVTLIGDNNVVNNNYIDLFKNLNLLKDIIGVNDQLNDQEKLNYQSNINTVQQQISTPNPSKGIIKLAWGSLEKLSTISGTIDIYNKIAPLVTSLLG